MTKQMTHNFVSLDSLMFDTLIGKSKHHTAIHIKRSNTYLSSQPVWTVASCPGKGKNHTISGRNRRN